MKGLKAIGVYAAIAMMIALFVSTVPFALADTTSPGTFRAPTIYKGAVNTKVYWTAGTVYNGGHSVTIAAGNANLTANQNDCAAPTFSACNMLYANSAGVVAVTQTLATAVGSGNTLLALIETGAADAIITNVVLPQQSGTLWLQAAGPNTAALTSVVPSGAGTVALGSAAKPFSLGYIGTAATNNFVFTPAATAGARVITIPDPGGAATLAYTNSTSSQAMSGLGTMLPHTAGTSNMGSAALPWGTIYTGTAATNNFVITPAATAAARVITLADPGGAATIAYTNPTTAQTITNTSLTTPTLTTPVYGGETALCTAQFNATSGDTGTTLTNVPGMVVTVVPGTYTFRVYAPGVTTTNAGIKLAFKYTNTVVSNLEATATGFAAAASATQHTTNAADQAVLFGLTAAATLETVIEGVMVVDTGGTIQLQAAQNASHGDTASIYARAYMTFKRIS